MHRIGRVAPGVAVVAFGVLFASLVAAETSPKEAWDAIYVGPSKVGHMHIRVEPLKDKNGEPLKDKNGRSLMRVLVDFEATFQRGKDAATTKVQYGTIETSDGTVLRLDTRTQASNGIIRMFGDVANGKMNLTMEAGGQQQSQNIDWSPEVRGPYGAEMSLARSPIKAGETREVKTYIPDLNKVCLTKLEAKGIEEVTLAQSAKHDLMRVEQSVFDLDGKPHKELKTTLWVDNTGQILKSYTDLLGGMLSYRTTKRAALAPNGEVNLLRFIEPKRRIRDAERTRDIVYQVTLKDDDPSDLLPNDRRQNVRKDVKPGSATVEVRTAGPADGTAGSETVDPTYLRPNPLVNSEDSNVVALARRAVGNQSDPWQKAVAIEKWVANNLRNKNFNIAFAPASEVARDLSGDCTEHGVLVAAMCRAVGVPARCAIGLVYVESKNGFGLHMWNEVYVNRRWVAVDAPFDQSDVDATHIKLSDTSLDGVSPFDAFLPVLRALDKMTIEPMEIR